ncbi:MAG TPA: sigma-70 family RNA polymerase sigma factor [Jiangellaceae bacterium]|jgi:RNA polymerase sigma-70 factor, ECF subfamily|nr:sigma-70 family RNA polymerase sigma factor [Jiangellaceae bacterium]
MRDPQRMAAAGLDALRLAVLQEAGLRPAVAGTWLTADSIPFELPHGGRVGHPEPSAPDDVETARLVALVDLARSGDSEAFGHLYDHYVGTVYRFIYYRVGSPAVAEDITSETFYRALRGISSFTWQGRDFGAWLVTIGRNLVADHFKSGRVRREVATDDIGVYDGATDGPEDTVVNGVTFSYLVRELRTLAPDQQDCLVLRFMQGMSVAETATALCRSEAAVRQLQLRAVRTLAARIPKDTEC